jgi:NADH dehydrogenase [ubiquinone] 1 alpha subcomplex assembly factor 1
MLRTSYLPIACAAVVLCGSAYAHRPTISDGSAADAEHAIEFEDVQVSRVVYHDVTEQAPQVWITFEVDQPQKLFLQIGVPVLDRLKAYRPGLALFGPGLPDVRLPFDSPSGLGGLILRTGDVDTPGTFFEPFTRTSSWILREEDVQLPEAGRYFVVAYEPSGEPGKLWVALGRKEDWGLRDMLNMPKIIAQVRGFHETAGRPEPSSTYNDRRIIFDFDAENSSGDWVAVNDGVMGGVSDGRVRITDEGFLEFAGSVSLENNGGFASIRSRSEKTDLGEFDGLLIRVRGDGKQYDFNLRTDVPIMAGSYRLKFETADQVWQEVFLPFAGFEATSFGRVIRNVPTLDPAKIRSMGFMISDKQEGAFKLEVDWIRAVRSQVATKEPGPAMVDQDKRAVARDVITMAIERGVPLFNNGQAEACAAIYEVTARTLVGLARDPLPSSSVKRLEAALRRASQTEDGSDRAWVLRHALDDTMRSDPCAVLVQLYSSVLYAQARAIAELRP